MCGTEVTHEPCSVTCLWIISWRHVEADAAALADEGAAAPGRGAATAPGAGRPALPEQSTVVEKPRAAGELGQPAPACVVGGEGVVHQAEVAARARAARRDVGADDRPGAHRPREHRRGQPDRPETGHQQGVPAGDVEPQQRLVGRAEAAGDQRPVDVRQGVGQRQAGASPRRAGSRRGRRRAASRRPLGDAVGAADQVAAAALLADPAAGDVVDHHPVAHGEPPAARADRDDLAARLVPGDDALVGLRPVAEVLAVDRPDVAAADRRRLHRQQHLAGPGLGHRQRSRARRVLSPGSRTPCIGRGHVAAPRPPAWRARRARAASPAPRRTPW